MTAYDPRGFPDGGVDGELDVDPKIRALVLDVPGLHRQLVEAFPQLLLQVRIALAEAVAEMKQQLLVS
ncbi:MAG: hypothetical protein IH849_11900 [Acidobacteria bacterium]|nr:hypothetical protein [Acidobacteriota bacterium]